MEKPIVFRRVARFACILGAVILFSYPETCSSQIVATTFTRYYWQRPAKAAEQVKVFHSRHMYDSYIDAAKKLDYHTVATMNVTVVQSVKEAIEDTLRKKAAELGADAVIIEVLPASTPPDSTDSSQQPNVTLKATLMYERTVSTGPSIKME